jgi:Glyoxalase-like domain
MKAAVGLPGYLAPRILHQKFGREAIEGHRTRPNGTDLKWKQIGVKEITDSREFPFFIQWLSADHPSQDGTPQAEIKKIVIADRDQLADSWFKLEIMESLGDVNIEWADPSTNDDQTGIVALYLSTSTGLVKLD